MRPRRRTLDTTSATDWRELGVQTHLTHVYAKVGLTSRAQLAQEAARRAQDAL
jgi:DNA-binding NarL/FixJ family response regulator